MDKPVLFIAHDLGRAGAEMALLHLLRWIKARQLFRFEVLVALPNDGPSNAWEYGLRAEIEALCPVHWLNRDGTPTNLVAIQAGQYSLLYANTIAHSDLLKSLGPLKTPIICHAHELRYSITVELGIPKFEVLRSLTTRWIACANVVRDTLVQCGVPTDRIEVVHECIPVAEIAARRLELSPEEVRARLKVKPDTFLIVSCGSFTWIKGYGILGALIEALRRERPELDFVFIWIGAVGTRREYYQVLCELAQARALPFARFTGAQTNPFPWMAGCDAFALLSRQDSFPLVMLEAAAVGLPLVGFDGAGGFSEFVQSDFGTKVPYNDLGSMAQALARLADDRQLRGQMSMQARHHVGHYDLDVQLPLCVAIIERTLKESV
jgi:glycosyltransferase involved in cell wall biosynthesis